MMLRCKYIGPDDALVGQTALLMPDDVGGWLAQFDSQDISQAFGWHPVDMDDFELLED